MNDRNRKLVSFVDELISERATHNGDVPEVQFSDLDEYDTNKLIRLTLEADGRDVYDVFISDKSTDIQDTLIRLLTQDNRDSRDDLVDAVLKNAREAYSERLQALIDERCMSFESEERHSNGQYRTRDNHTGEFTWSRL